LTTERQNNNLPEISNLDQENIQGSILHAITDHIAKPISSNRRPQSSINNIFPSADPVEILPALIRKSHCIDKNTESWISQWAFN